jgi:hypothetical protein
MRLKIMVRCDWRSGGSVNELLKRNIWGIDIDAFLLSLSRSHGWIGKVFYEKARQRLAIFLETASFR